MNNKMGINTYLPTIESIKNKTNKQAEHKQNHRYRECFYGCLIGEVSEGWVEKVKGLGSTN